MKVFFTCSAKNIKVNESGYKEIRNQIINLGHTLNRDWIDRVIKLSNLGRSDMPSYKFYSDVIGAILTSDVVVVDATVQTMALGHQLTYALEKNKPVLLLNRKGRKSKKIFIEGSKVDNLVVCSYRSLKEIKMILSKFFERYDDKNTSRFNLALTQEESNYISWAAYNYKKTKTEIIQQSIDKTSRSDKEYKDYLDRQP